PEAGSRSRSRRGGWASTRRARLRSRMLLLGLEALDEIAGHRPAAVEPLPRHCLHGIGRDGADMVGPGLDHVDGLAAGDRRAVPARERRLIVLSIDRFGD